MGQEGLHGEMAQVAKRLIDKYLRSNTCAHGNSAKFAVKIWTVKTIGSLNFGGYRIFATCGSGRWHIEQKYFPGKKPTIRYNNSYIIHFIHTLCTCTTNPGNRHKTGIKYDNLHTFQSPKVLRVKSSNCELDARTPCQIESNQGAHTDFTNENVASPRCES